MVDVLGAGAADGAVEGPIGIEREQISEFAQVGAALGFAAADALAGVFDYLFAGGDKLGRIHAPAVDLRAGEPHAETGVSPIDLGTIAVDRCPWAGIF